MSELSFGEAENWVDFVERQIGYKFVNRDLLVQAFVRKSYSMENGGENNEVLEFIGDKALDLSVVKTLTDKYGHMISDEPDYEDEDDEFYCEYSEGKLTHLKSLLVRKEYLSARIDELKLAPFLIMSKGDLKNNIDKNTSVKEDLFEAIIGAVTLDTLWDFDKIQDVVGVMLRPELILDADVTDDNYIKLIQDWESKHYNDLPKFLYKERGRNESIRVGKQSLYWRYGSSTPESVYYKETCYTYPYGNEHLRYECKMKLSDDLPEFGAYGESKSDARRKVCECAYKFLEKEDLLWTIKDEIENPNKAEAISQLEILARRGYFSMPEYEYIEQYDENGNPIWNVECHIEEEKYYFDAEASSKKVAKKQAAYDMLMYVLGEE